MRHTPASHQNLEQERVAFIFGSLGGYTNLAVRQYLNDNKIPHLLLAVAADIVGDPEHYPWTIGLNPAISSEVHIYAKYILATKPKAKIGVLYQHDGVFKIFVTAMREGVGAENASMIVGETSYELSEPTVDFPNHQPARVRRGYADHRGEPQGRGAGHPQSV